ncbi:MAG: hypothetical protein U0325_01120 [Polyangiales bacterium]
MKHSARLALTLLSTTLAASALAAGQNLATTPLALPNKVRTVRPIFTIPTILPGAVAPIVAPATQACAPIREVALTSGVSALTLAPVASNACAPAAPIARTSTAQETLRLRVTTRAAVMLASGGGALTLFNEQGTATPLQTAVGACGAGMHVGAAILEPGVYVLRAPGTAGGSRAVSVESVPVRAGGAVERVGAGETALSTGGSDEGGACQSGDGVDVRVLACPGVQATIRADRGALVSLEGASSGRTCFSAPAGMPTQATRPAGRLVVVRAFPQGANRGAVSVSFR